MRVISQDGTFQYLIAERDGVKVNLFAHVRNNLMNETFGICQNRYKASAEQLSKIKSKKEEIFDALRKCSTVDEMLECEVAKPYISAAWLDTPESMIVRKMRNNAIKKYRKDFNSMAKQSFNQLDETYVQTQEEIAENANTEDFPVEPEVAETVEDPKMAETEKVTGEVVENDENVPEFMKD